MPRKLDLVVRKAMERRLDARFQSARELHDALEEWLRSEGVSATSSDAADYLATVFARRIQERQELISAAMRADLTPHSAKSFDQLARVRGKEPSGSSGARTAPKPPPPARPTLLWGAVAVVVLAGAVGLGVALAPGAPPVPEPPSRIIERPPLAPPVLVVDSVPSGAALVVDGQPRGMTPLTLDDLGLGEHRLDATLAGYLPTQRMVSLPRAAERVVVELALVPEPAPPAVPANVDAGVKPKPKGAVEAPGRLTLKTDPWTTVYLGRRRLGDTPLLNVPLPAGRHLLRLVNPEQKLERTVEIEIQSNETTMKRLSL